MHQKSTILGGPPPATVSKYEPQKTVAFLCKRDEDFAEEKCTKNSSDSSAIIQKHQKDFFCILRPSFCYIENKEIVELTS